MDRIFHIHAKFYEMLENETEYSIPYDEVIPVLKEGGYQGYFSSEYEGNRHIQDVFEVDSVEQVRRQQKMFKKLLNEKMSKRNPIPQSLLNIHQLDLQKTKKRIMFEKYMIVEKDTKNIVEDGKVTGFRVGARVPYYRGLGISMIEDIQLSVDGKPFLRMNLR